MKPETKARPTIIAQVAAELSNPESHRMLHHNDMGAPMPSVEDLHRIVEDLRAVIFPGYFGDHSVAGESLHYYVGHVLDRTFSALSEQIFRGLCLDGTDEAVADIRYRARTITENFLLTLPAVRGLLASDVQAAYNGDPAARNLGESIYCYPSIRALTNHRLAHELFRLGVPLIPRVISEMAHSATGIDIHPGAAIGSHFFMDHGTGIVIGETAVIGTHVRIYQGVTLGAKSFPLDDKGIAIKGRPRHPVVQDNVIIYSGATILGRVTIGRDSIIGGNVWLTHSVSPGSRILQSGSRDFFVTDGAGI